MNLKKFLISSLTIITSTLIGQDKVINIQDGLRDTVKENNTKIVNKADSTVNNYYQMAYKLDSLMNAEKQMNDE